MVKIEYIKTNDIYCPQINNYEHEDEVVRPGQSFKDMDEAWAYAMAHGCNPMKNIRVYNV